METNKFLWSNRNLENPSAREQETLNFIERVQATSPEFDFSSIADEFSKIPEINIFDKKFPELSFPAKKVFEKIYATNARNPEYGLKIITILASNIECAFYPSKLKETVFNRLKEWLLSDSLPKRTRIEWGIFCWKNWPVRHSNYDKNEFVEPLVKLFIQESQLDPEYILDIYDNLFERRSDNSYIFNQFREDPEDFLLFARNIKEMRPQFLADALMRFMRDGKRGRGGYTADITKLQSACNELFGILESGASLAKKQRERITRELILYSYPEIPWYNELHEKLWNIEKDKDSLDRESIRNYFVVSVNSPQNFKCLPEINRSYKKWLNLYQDPGWLSRRNIIEHSKEMLDLINFSLHVEYPITRNRSFDKPNNDLLIKETISSYWQMIDYLKDHDFELYLYALETAMEKPTFTVAVTDDIGNKAKHFLLSTFENYCIHDMEKASSLVTYMISRSGYTEIQLHIREVLDIIYPVLFSINSTVAEKSLSEGIKSEHGHMTLWRPRISP